MVQTSNLLFPGPGKSKRLRLPIWKKQNGSDIQFAFSRAGKKQNGPDFQFPGLGKSKMAQTSNFAFSRPGKKEIGSLSRKSKLDIQLAFAKPEKSNYVIELWSVWSNG